MGLIKEQPNEKSLISNSVLRIVVLVCSIVITLMLSLNQTLPEGFSNLYIIPILFGLYFMFSQLASAFLKSISLSFFSIVLMCRYLVTPFVMCVSNKYSAMYYGAGTSDSQRALGIDLMIYEMVVMFIIIEICMHNIYNKKNILAANKTENVGSFSYPNTVYIISICIGFLGLLLFPQLLESFNFLFVNKELDVSNRKTIVVLFSYFLEFVQIFLFIIVVKRSLYKKANDQKYSLILLMLVSVINITFMWSANRMTIILVAGTTLAVLLYAFPEKKKIFFLFILCTSVLMVVVLSSYRLFGTIGSQIDNKSFSKFFDLHNLSRQFQIYFAGPDSVAGAVATKQNYDGLITSKTFLNDSFLGVNFIRQLPALFDDRSNATINYFNLYCCNGTNIGLIIPMVGQGYTYFGFLLSPIFTIISAILMFLSERKANNATDIGYKYVFILLTLNFALFPMYNYTLIIQNVFNRFIPLFLIVWFSQYVFFKEKAQTFNSRYIKNGKFNRENRLNVAQKESYYIK